ncbi:MAG: major capsid protein [Microviridae sp.]|nr:MAG: major capsid protein [Microviridae sp.]AXQ66205.1 MAG: major capsid protein [Microviridae sp.]
MKKSKFNLSHDASLTASMGNLIPFVTLDCLPNDSHRLKLQSFVRAQPMLAPLMHRVNLYAQYWFVPYRLLWNDWETFITGGNSGDEDKGLVFPTIKIKPETSSLADYFGLPPNGKELEVSAMPFRAMAEIWNTRYRDEDLQVEVPISYEGGVDTTTNTKLLRCSWAKDRFTIARPFTQRGAQISVPVKGSLPVTEKFATSISVVSVKTASPTDTFLLEIDSSYFSSLNYNGEVVFHFDGNSTASGVYPSRETSAVRGGATILSNPFEITILFSQVRTDLAVSSGNVHLSVANDGTLNSIKPTMPYVAISSYTTDGSVNIRDLRAASQLQRYQERSLEYGNRYEEFIQREFGIKPRDSRIQRPEYLGGGSSVLQISEVLQTAEGENTGVGTMRGHGVSAFGTRGIRFRAPEHGIVIGLLSIRPHGVYTQGVEKFWRKFSKFDYYTPELANIGMQEIWQSELYADGNNFNTVFGYEGRYDEYRKMPNRVSGEFRDLLDYWNLARKFEAPPVLNSSFITMEPSKRPFAEQTQDSFLIMLRNSIRSFRCVPKRAKNLLR